MYSALKTLILTLPLLACATEPIRKVAVPDKSPWQEFMLTHLKSLDKESDIGVYMKNVNTGKEVSFHGDSVWYMASAIKVPVAVTVLKEVDAGNLALETKVEVLDSDYIDGAGELNYIKPGSQVSVRMLLDQSLTFSDNTATDILIRLVGLEKVNALVNGLVPQAFKPITTLAEVRRQVFSELHPGARDLSNMDFIRIWVVKDEQERLDRFAKLLKVKRSDLKFDNLDAAYSAYYAKQLNSATLHGYAALLEKLLHGSVLKDGSRKFLFDVLERIETGKDRIKAGLPKSYIFAHKTGTQFKRICDMGVMTNGTPGSDRIVVVACVRGMKSEDSNVYLKKIGQIISESGVLAKGLK
jgi:beta-lactamase class A